MTELRACHFEKHGQAGDSDCRGKDFRGSDGSVLEARSNGEGEDEAEHKERFDQCERASPQRQKLKKVADAVEGSADEPERSASQSNDEAGFDGHIWRLVAGGVMLQHRCRTVGCRAQH